jgi:hypothetical protein
MEQIDRPMGWFDWLETGGMELVTFGWTPDQADRPY